MTPLTTERLFWHCGAHTAEPKLDEAHTAEPEIDGMYTAEPEIDDMSSIPPIPYYQNLLFSVPRGA